MRAPAKLPDGTDWVGKRVRYTPRGGEAPPEEGVVTRMATGKSLAMFVQYDTGGEPKYTYTAHLEKLS